MVGCWCYAGVSMNRPKLGLVVWIKLILNFWLDAAGAAVATPSLERKIHYTKNKLPTAVLKPDNPRAIRYWLQRRRQARPKSQDPVSPPDPEEADLNIDSIDFELFHLGRELGVHDVLGQRVLQVVHSSTCLTSCYTFWLNWSNG